MPHSEPVAKCPLCESGDVETAQEMDVARVAAVWRQSLGFDVSDEFRGVSTLSRMTCRGCALEYFVPPVAGSERVYRELQKLPWYYAAEKWEYGVALDDVSARSRVLEVGCGDGAFLALLQTRKHADARGLELNAAAAEEGRRKGRIIDVGDVAALADSGSPAFDVVCHFQVLEHVAQPREFLDACVRLVRPGGLLCFGTPNNDGYLGRLPEAVLNTPPHHVTRWGARTLNELTRLFPLRLHRMAFEPLDRMHIGAFTVGHIPAPANGGPARILRGASRRLAHVALQLPAVRRLFRGHGVYASFVRTV